MPCTLGVKFCKEPNLLAYADMSQNGKLILKSSSTVIDNTIRNGTAKYYYARGIRENND
jgi:hypothetical protein